MDRLTVNRLLQPALNEYAVSIRGFSIKVEDTHPFKPQSGWNGHAFMMNVEHALPAFVCHNAL
jgi:hypothetical protein